MIKLPSSFFAKLYRYIFVAMLSSVALTFIVIDRWNERSSSEDFVRDTLMVKAQLEAQRQSTDLSVPSFYQSLNSFWLPFDIKWQPTGSMPKYCDDCEYLDKHHNVSVYEAIDGRLISVHALPENQGTLVIGDRDEETILPANMAEADVIDLEDSAMIIFCIFIIFSSGIALYLPLRNLQKDINHLDHISEQIGRGEFDVQKETELSAPLNKLADSLHVMASALSHKFNDSQVFAQAVPHELRTPLSRIQLATGILRQKSPSEDQLALIDNIDDYIDDIDELCSQIITFSKLSINNKPVPKQSLNIGEFIHTRVQQLDLPSDKAVSVSGMPDIELAVNEVNFRLVVDNLLNNAGLYAMHQVVVIIEQDKNSVTLRVTDDGAGILDQDKADVFVPFARVDKSRNRKTGGLGLGLAITAAAVNTLNGSITIEDATPSGASFIVILPR